ncbi:MAG: PIN domain nuclease [Candidatus Altiarchaeales archaeon HGW-Altiarchaeales-1]|nr:MAG: PIN domain nuclease [Candidatus Altiarchaeales archaeon HGW-Altiarchaeales-1]
MEIKSVIGKHRRIMFDTAPIVYFIEENKDFSNITDEIFKLINDSHGYYYPFSSVITLIEVLTQPFKKSRMDLVKKYREFLLNASNFTIYSIDPIVAEKAAELRAQYAIKTPDAIQLAVAIENIVNSLTFDTFEVNSRV